MRTIAELLRWRARRHPELEAIREDGRSVTWAGLDAGSTALARGFAGAGVSRGDRVAILDKNSGAYMELVFALAKLGAVAAPVNWRLQPHEAAQIVGDSSASLLVCGEDFRGAADACGARVLGFDEMPREDGPDPGQDLPADVVWQLYTSGTTGVPKGAMLTHDNLFSCMSGITIEAPEMRQGGRSLVAMPLYHIGGCGWALACMWAGTTLVIEREVIPQKLLATIVEQRIETAFLVPAVLLFLTQVPGVEQADFSSLGRIFYGASPITPELLSRCIELFGCRFTQVYGLTETTGAVTTLPHEDHSGERLLSCGRANLGTDIRIVDAGGNDLPTGEVGEIVIRTMQNMAGYWRRDDDTAAVLRDGWFHTGDAGCLDPDGYLYIRDRIKDMIVSGGENVYPVEVEAVLAEHPDVVDVAVLGVPDVRWGETVKAVVVLRAGAAADAAALIEFCRPRLAGFKRPTSVDFVAGIPRNPTGKVLKRELREQYWRGQGRMVGGSG
ncbi:MAG: fatty acid--CoA ligase [Chloroflexi bacterium]|nr:MAG: fatty acid--CoA ligase [Chloroflexota bacterium]